MSGIPTPNPDKILFTPDLQERSDLNQNEKQLLTLEKQTFYGFDLQNFDPSVNTLDDELGLKNIQPFIIGGKLEWESSDFSASLGENFSVTQITNIKNQAEQFEKLLTDPDVKFTISGYSSDEWTTDAAAGEKEANKYYDKYDEIYKSLNADQSILDTLKVPLPTSFDKINYNNDPLSKNRGNETLSAIRAISILKVLIDEGVIDAQTNLTNYSFQTESNRIDLKKGGYMSAEKEIIGIDATKMKLYEHIYKFEDKAFGRGKVNTIVKKAIDRSSGGTSGANVGQTESEYVILKEKNYSMGDIRGKGVDKVNNFTEAAINRGIGVIDKGTVKSVFGDSSELYGIFDDPDNDENDYKSFIKYGKDGREVDIGYIPLTFGDLLSAYHTQTKMYHEAEKQTTYSATKTGTKIDNDDVIESPTSYKNPDEIASKNIETREISKREEMLNRDLNTINYKFIDWVYDDFYNNLVEGIKDEKSLRETKIPDKENEIKEFEEKIIKKQNLLNSGNMKKEDEELARKSIITWEKQIEGYKSKLLTLEQEYESVKKYKNRSTEALSFSIIENDDNAVYKTDKFDGYTIPMKTITLEFKNNSGEKESFDIDIFLPTNYNEGDNNYFELMKYDLKENNGKGPILPGKDTPQLYITEKNEWRTKVVK